jgi:hypothetical protein
MLENILIAEACTLWVAKNLLHREQKNKRPKITIFKLTLIIDLGSFGVLRSVVW